MTLNAVIALILRFLRDSTDFQANYLTVVEDRPNVRKSLSPSSSVLLLAKTITDPAARSLCDSWASCIC